MTHTKIPQQIQHILSLGPKFKIRPTSTSLNIFHTFANVEYLLNGVMNKDTADIELNIVYRAQITIVLANFYHTEHT